MEHWPGPTFLRLRFKALMSSDKNSVSSSWPLWSSSTSASSCAVFSGVTWMLASLKKTCSSEASSWPSWPASLRKRAQYCLYCSGTRYWRGTLADLFLNLLGSPSRSLARVMNSSKSTSPSPSVSISAMNFRNCRAESRIPVLARSSCSSSGEIEPSPEVSNSRKVLRYFRTWAPSVLSMPTPSSLLRATAAILAAAAPSAEGVSLRALPLA
mmetsp:Transcript_38046/g.82870  ORF Transcript_38046/g.82870 Transcript_38046/m.82870 type:complete len:212 (-) Transcript_38046:3-638(-)